MSDRPRTPCPTCGQAIEPDETDVVEAVEIVPVAGETIIVPEDVVGRRAAFHPACFPDDDPGWRRL